MKVGEVQTERAERRAGSKPYAAAFVCAVWLLSLLIPLYLVWLYGSDVPSWDDWDMVPAMTGHQPVTASWLWSQHNEHRVPLPRLVSLALYWGIREDFRVVMYFNVLIVAALAFSLILAAKRLRGYVRYSDAFFPLLLLSWGQGVNFIWSWQLEYFLSTALVGIVLLVIVQSGERLGKRAAAAMGLCFILLVMCGAHGVVALPGLMVWLGFSAVLRLYDRDADAKSEAYFLFGVCLLAVLLVGLYFAGYEAVPYHPTNRKIRVLLRTAAQFLTMGFGAAIRSVWPWSGIAAVSLLSLSVAVLAAAGLRRPKERVRAAGLFLFLGALISLALGIGLGRDGFEPRYATLSVPIWCCVYFVGEIYGSARIRRLFQTALLIIVGAAFWPNTIFGIAYAKDLRSHLRSFEQDMSAGVPKNELIGRYSSYLHPHHDIPDSYMPMLRQAGIGSFGLLHDPNVFREIPIPLIPTKVNQVRWENGIANSTGYNPYFILALPADTRIAGIRMKYTSSNADGTCPYISFYWKRNDQADFTVDQFYKYSPTGDRANWCHGVWTQLNDRETTAIVWLSTTLGKLRIHPDFKPGVFKIAELVLLESDSPAAQ